MLLPPGAGATHSAPPIAPGALGQRQGLAQGCHKAGEATGAGESPAQGRRRQEKQKQCSACLREQ